MKTSFSLFESYLERFSKLANVGFKFSIALGGIFVIVYALRIGHFPQGISLGDGLLFLLAAGCFGVVYAFFVGSILSLGICLSLIVRPVLIWIVTLCCFIKASANIKKQKYNFAPFDWRAIPFAVFAVFFIIKFGQEDLTVFWGLPLLSVGLYFTYSAALALRGRAKQIEKLLSSLIYTSEKEQIQHLSEFKRHSSGYLFCIILTLLLPLMVGGVNGKLMDGAMRLAHVRIENSIIYIKEPYNAFFPLALIKRISQVPEGYTAYGDITVLFKGFGNTVVVEFKDGESQRKLEIPNNHVIIEYIK